MDHAERSNPSPLGIIVAVLWRPRAWFASMADGSQSSAIAFALLINLVAVGTSRSLAHHLDATRPTLGLLTFASTGGELLFALYLQAASVYLLGRATGKPVLFRVVVRCLAYAQVPMLLSALPWISSLLCEVWCMGLSVIALSAALQRSWRFVLAGLGLSWVVLVAVFAGMWQFLSS